MYWFAKSTYDNIHIMGSNPIFSKFRFLKTNVIFTITYFFYRFNFFFMA